MDNVNLLLRLLLFAIFAIAGWSKIKHHDGLANTISSIGFSNVLAKPAAIALPWVELAVAGLLVPHWCAWLGSLAALLLLLLFIVTIIVVLAKGQQVECRCFGQLDASPIGGDTLLRNVVFANAAGWLTLRGPDNIGPGLVDWIAGLQGVEAAVWFVSATLIIGMALIVKMLKTLLHRQEALFSLLDMEHGGFSNGLPVGLQAPDFWLSSLDGKVLSLQDCLVQSPRLLLIFVYPGCVHCEALLPDIVNWQSEWKENVTIAVISRGTVEENRSKMGDLGIERLLLQQQWEVGNDYLCSSAPSAQLIDRNRRIASPLFSGVTAIREFVAASNVRGDWA